MNTIQKLPLIIVLFATVVVAVPDPQPECNCAVFKSTTPNETEETPILSKSPTIPIECNNTGKESCAKMCVALAEVSRESGPSLLCKALGNTSEPFQPAVFSKVCDDKKWINTGLIGKQVLCCENHAPIQCDSVRGSPA